MTSEKDIRDAFFDEIAKYVLSDPRYHVLTNDMDVYSLREINRLRPNQLINVGVAEQNTLNVAAGLASTGCKVLVFGISSFFAFRSYEQLRISIAGMRLPVTVVGVGQGFSFSYDGPTHHGVDDLGVLRTIPELEVLSPGDCGMARECATYASEAPGPKYVRLDKGIYPSLYSNSEKLELGFKVISEISEVTVVATGSLLPMAHEVVDELRSIGTNIGLVDVVRINPLPKELLQALSTSKHVIVVEENSSRGGLFSAILESKGHANFEVSFLGSGLGTSQVFAYGSRSWHLDNAGLTRQSLFDRIDCAITMTNART